LADWLAARGTAGWAVTANQVLAGVGLILVLAVGSQVLANGLRIPALIILLPAGFIAGAVTADVNPQRLFGAAFQPLVSLSVAVILYDAGLGLDLRKLHGHTRHIVTWLIVVGVPVTWGFAAAFAAFLLGMSTQAAVLTGAILVVSGPTVVGPLLSLVRPTERLQRVLIWEGSLIDPIGGILGAVVYSAVLSTHKVVGYRAGDFLVSIGVGVAGAVVGTAALWFLLRVLRLGEILGTTSQLACVVGAAAACDMVRDDSGLIAAVLMGLAVANMRGFDVPARRPFFETLVQLIISVLFVAISATVTPQSLRHLVLPTLGLVAVLVLVTRPLVAQLSTIRTDMSTGERWFTGWMAPRGIVAAATGRGGQLEGVNAVLLLTSEDDFNALASAILEGSVDGPVYRLGPRLPGHGVVAPYTGGQILFGAEMTRYEIGRRYASGARVVSRPADGRLPAGTDLLFLVKADGRLIPVTSSSTPAPRSGDTVIVLETRLMDLSRPPPL
jgi:NhaP-type Na+/H+ or K+/H+ antiporter